MNNFFFEWLSKTFSVCYLVSMQLIRIGFFFTKLCKWWYLIAMCFVLGENLLNSATAMQLWLSLKTLLNTSGFGRWISKINNTNFISAIKCIMLHIAWINAIYSASVVLKAFSVCNLLHHNTIHPAYIITYPVRDINVSALSTSDWAQ